MADEEDIEREPGTVAVPPARFDRLLGGGSVMVPFLDYCEVVARAPDARSADRYGLVAALHPGPVTIVSGAGKQRRAFSATITAVRKGLAGPSDLPRLSRLRLVIQVQPLTPGGHRGQVPEVP